jgi:murein DD-endopeptidase MepM/ murein hydrolase activator NlpD
MIDNHWRRLNLSTPHQEARLECLKQNSNKEFFLREIAGTLRKRGSYATSRRKYLEYAGAAAILVAATALGLDYLRSGNENKPTTSAVTTTLTTSSTISSITSSTTSTTTKLASLNGRLFFDYNGNGIQDEREPAVQGATVQLKDNTDQIIADAVTDSSGDYKIEDVPAGNYGLYVDTDKRFRYMCQSAQEFRTVQAGYSVLLNESMKANIGLMEGFLTLPFSRPDILNNICAYVDLDFNESKPRDWMNESTHTFHGNRGTAFCMSIDNDVVAAALGIVVEAMGTWPNVPTNPNLGYLDDGNRVSIDHGPISTFITENNSWFGDRFNFLTIYCHLNSVSVNVGQRVNRGDLIGKSGRTGRMDGAVSHLYFQAGGFAFTRVDPFRDITGFSDKLSYWTMDNDPKLFCSDAEIFLP